MKRKMSDFDSLILAAHGRRCLLLEDSSGGSRSP